MERLLPFDELNMLQASMRITISENIPAEEKKKQIAADMEDFFITAYMMGVFDTEDRFGRTYEPPQEKLYDAIYKRFDGEDFRDRINVYVDTQDIAGLANVADTNMTRLYSTGANDAGESFGGGVKTWQTMEDDKVRDTHFYLQGVSVPTDQRFYTYDGDSARFPGDFALSSNNCNCRCYIQIQPKGGNV